MIIKLKDLIKEITSDDDSRLEDERMKRAELYFSIGQDEEDLDNNYCWIWNRNDVIAKKGGTHGINFSHDVADRNFKGWYDVQKNAISIVFPEHEERKLSGRQPTVDDIPEYLYQKLIRKFGKRTPKFFVFENKQQLNEKMFPKKFERHELGACMDAAELATKYLWKNGIRDFKIIEGWVSMFPNQEEEDWSAHTWLVIKGRIFDPTKKQWSQWGFDPAETKYEKVKEEYTPMEYLEHCKVHPGNYTNQINDKEDIDETMSYNDLMKTVDSGRKDRSKQVRNRSLPVSVDEGYHSWNFRYKSNPSVTRESFNGQITFFKKGIKNGKNVADIPCKVDCGCPDFMYRWAYNDSAENASQIGNNSLNRCINRKPQTAYDYGVGMCKHLVALSGYLKTSISNTKKSNLFEAMSEVVKQKNFEVPYYD